MRILYNAGVTLLFCGTSFATTWTVDDDGNDFPNADFNNIQAAVNAASDGDEILIYPGNYYGSGNEVVDTLGKAVWLHGYSYDPTNTRIQGENTRRGITCRETSGKLQVTLENLYIIYGDAEYGGGVWIEGNPTVTHCWITNNNATVGGNVNIESGNPLFNGSTYFQTGVAEHGGGVYAKYGYPVFNVCFFRWNTATVKGGGLRGYNIAGEFTDCDFDTNESPRGAGAAMHANWGSDYNNFTNCEFKNNTSSNLGGGIENLYGSGGTFDTCSFTNNIATSKSGGQGSGGGMFIDNDDISLVDCLFENNNASTWGAGIYNWNASTDVTSTTFYQNAASVGGGVHIRSSGYGTFTSCTFADNSATTSSYYSGGGGAYQSSTGKENGVEIDTTFIDCDFDNNNATSQGGAMYFNYSNARLDSCTMSNNSAINGGDGVAGFTANYTFANTNVIDDLLFTDSVTLTYESNSACTVNGGWALYTHFCLVNTTFDIDNLDANTQLTVNGTLTRGGSLSITNESGSLSQGSVGDQFTLVESASASSYFDGVVFPVMPSGLGLDLVENQVGSGVEIAVEIIDDAGSQLNEPNSDYIWIEPVDLLSLDADGDGVDEVAALFDGDGAAGYVQVYRVSYEGAPVLIPSFQTTVGNSPVGFDAADLDGDGREDLIIANAESKTVSVLISEDDDTFAIVQTIDFSDPVTCVAVVDWDGDQTLDAVVGVDFEDNSNYNDAFQVLLDVGSDWSTGPIRYIPNTTISDSTEVNDTATCVDGGDKSSSWGFVGGTRYGQALRAEPDENDIHLLAETMGNLVSIKALELSDNGGDGLIDIFAVSDEAKALYLFEGVAGVDGGTFGDVIPLEVSVTPADILSLDIDRDGDMDFLVAAPTSETPLLILRNDGTADGLLPGGLGGRNWSGQDANATNSPSKICGGDTGGKNETDDWFTTTGDPPTARDNCIMAQTNLSGRIWVVDADGSGDFTSIQAAIDVVALDESIMVLPGTYYGSGGSVIDMSGKSIRLYSMSGEDQTIIDGQNTRRGILCNNSETEECSIEGFTIQNCDAPDTSDMFENGAGMHIFESSPSVSNCVFLNNSSLWGSGMYIWSASSDVAIQNCVFEANEASQTGAAIRCNASTAIISNCSFTHNDSNVSNGAALALNAASSATELGNSTFCNNNPYHIEGTYVNSGENTFHALCAGDCPADLNNDGTVNVADLLDLIAAWGTCNDCAADFDGDGTVAVADLLTLIAAWGNCE